MVIEGPPGPKLTLLGGTKIGVAEIEQLYQRLTGKAMTEAERAYAAQAVGSSSGATDAAIEPLGLEAQRSPA